MSVNELWNALVEAWCFVCNIPSLGTILMGLFSLFICFSVIKSFLNWGKE